MLIEVELELFVKVTITVKVVRKFELRKSQYTNLAAAETRPNTNALGIKEGDKIDVVGNMPNYPMYKRLDS